MTLTTFQFFGGIGAIFACLLGALIYSIVYDYPGRTEIDEGKHGAPDRDGDRPDLDLEAQHSANDHSLGLD